MTEVGALENTFWYWVNPLSWFPKWMFVNGFTYLSLICGFSLVFPRYSISIVILAVAFAVLAVVNHFMFRMHSSLFALVDFKNIGTAVNVIGSYHFRIDKYIVMIAVLLLILFGISAFLFRRKELDYTHDIRHIALNSIMCVVPMYVIYFGPSPIMVDKTNTGAWHTDRLYADCGYVPVIIENAKKGLGSVIRPDWYDHSALMEIPGVDNADTVSAEEYPDVLIILNETWYDPADYIDFETDIDYMDNYRSLDNAILGHAVVPGFAGGTNNSEYEYLTSNSMSLLTDSTPFQTMSMIGAHSIVDYMEALGYETIGEHPTLSSNYNRGASWFSLGFDHCSFEEDFKPMEYYRHYCSDEYAFRAFLDMMEDMDPERPHFGYLLTLQNHGDWADLPEEDIYISIKTNDLYDEATTHRLREFISCIKLTDESIVYLTDRLNKLYAETGRKVIVCMVGDHAPTIIYDLECRESPEAQILAAHEVPYFIWANYPFAADAVKNTNTVDLCNLVPIVLKTAGIPLSAYYSHIIDMMNAGIAVHTQIFTDLPFGSWYGADGMIHEPGDDSLSNMIRVYYSLEYNNAANKDRIDDLFFAQIAP